MNSRNWIGGQAVMEGVMMRDRGEMVIACRKDRGDISVHREEVSKLASRFPFLRWPLLRGIVAFIEALTVGIKALNISTAEVLEEEGEEVHPLYTVFTVALGLALGVGLFFLLPTLLANYLPAPSALVSNLLEGLLRIGIFISYIYLISRWGEIQRFFAYHGAEHKAIYCYEAGKDLKVENASLFSTKHPRCGTSFLLIVMIVSILLFSLFGWPGLWERFLIRLALLPAVAAVAYELIRLTSQSSWKPLRALALPGVWLQHLTTREPDGSQLEVALEALRNLVGSGENIGGNTACADEALDSTEADEETLQEPQSAAP